MDDYTLTVYSAVPYHKSKEFVLSFKNGRSYKGTPFAEYLPHLAKKIESCPAFHPLNYIVPVPRSGNSEPSFEANSEPYPAWALAKEISNIPFCISKQFIARSTPIQSSSKYQDRSVDRHLKSMSVLPPIGLANENIMLIDDVLTTGCQAMACYVKLREAGYSGEISCFVIGYTPKKPPYRLDIELKPRLAHTLKWSRGQTRPQTVAINEW